MKKQSNNTRSNILSRLRYAAGGVMAFVGFVMFCLVASSSSFNFSNMMLIISVVLFIGGLLLAGSVKLIQSFSDMFR